MKIEDYGLIGDTHTAALVGRNGSVDWLCLPRFDSGACFAALLGEEKHGCWQLAPTGDIHAVRRRYRPDTLVLETEFETADGGCVRVTDCMPPRKTQPDVVRLVEGVRGRVKMRMRLVVRFDYGTVAPHLVAREVPGEFAMVAGPDALILRTAAPAREGPERTVVADFEVGENERVPFVLSWHRSYEPVPDPLEAAHEIAATEAWWREWIGGCTCREGPWVETIRRSLLTIKALTYGPSGGIVAAPTTSLPEALGGVRNWDYRYCWLRDAAFTLVALLGAGFTEEAERWRDWLLRAVAADPANAQILYGLGGERRLPSFELPDLPGYEGSRPVTVGNAAATQFQLDVYGEVIAALQRAREAGLPAPKPAGIDKEMQSRAFGFLESHWSEPDEGIWEIRGPRQHFTHSKVMAWVALDRLVKNLDPADASANGDRWRQVRDAIHRDVCEKGYDPHRQTFTQYYGSKGLDAGTLIMPLVGFLPPEDPRIHSTVEAVERELLEDGLVLRYRPETDGGVDGLPGKEGAFLPCSFWLASCYHLLGRKEEARQLFERLLGLCNDLGLMSEEYDTANQRLLGNFPQTFSHVAIVHTALLLRGEMR